MPTENAKRGSEESSVPPVDAEVCRICMLTAIESGLALEQSGCHCTGSMSLCHRECLEKWMVYQRSRVCELCHGLFQFALDETKITDNIQKELLLARKRHADGCRSHRIWYLVCTCFLVLTAASSASLSVFAVRFDDALRPLMSQPPKPLPRLPSSSDWTTATTGEALTTEGNHPQVFCIVVTAWLVALVVVVVFLWVFVELVLWPREAQLVVNIAWFTILYEIYERIMAAEQGNIQRAILASTREAAAGVGGTGANATAAPRNPDEETKANSRA